MKIRQKYINLNFHKNKLDHATLIIVFIIFYFNLWCPDVVPEGFGIQGMKTAEMLQPWVTATAFNSKMTGFLGH